MAKPMWSFEMLAQANRATLEQVLVASKAPDLYELDSHVYNGYNCQPARYIRLPAIKFRKAFLQKNGSHFGLNQWVEQDNNDFTGEWRVQMQGDKPVERGFFRVAPVTLSDRRFDPYRHLIGLDYNVGLNPKWNLIIRAIYDFVGLPNEGDYSVLLGKAYLRILPSLSVFACYFVLGHREPYHSSPRNSGRG